MQKKHFFLIVASLLMLSSVNANTPLWTFTPLTSTSVTLPADETALVQYRVTNQSNQLKTLAMKPIPGVTQRTTQAGDCGNPFVLEGKAFCTLSLVVTINQVPIPFNAGPVVCCGNCTNQCYQPAEQNILHVTPIRLTAITPSSGTQSGGTGFTLTGTGLTGTTNVFFNDEAAFAFTVVNPTTITGVTPAASTPGSVTVTINTPNGGAALTDGFTYQAPAPGQPSNGGIIACMNSGVPTLIAATSDIPEKVQWGGLYTTTGATSTTDGAANTITIVNTLGTGTGNIYAARLCAEYEVDSQGHTPCDAGNTCYSDWFLPAIDQLNCLYTNRNEIGGFSDNGYWSSTEQNYYSSWYQIFIYGDEGPNSKAVPFKVRCVRSP